MNQQPTPKMELHYQLCYNCNLPRRAASDASYLVRYEIHLATYLSSAEYSITLHDSCPLTFRSVLKPFALYESPCLRGSDNHTTLFNTRWSVGSLCRRHHPLLSIDTSSQTNWLVSRCTSITRSSRLRHPVLSDNATLPWLTGLH